MKLTIETDNADVWRRVCEFICNGLEGDGSTVVTTDTTLDLTGPFRPLKCVGRWVKLPMPGPNTQEINAMKWPVISGATVIALSILTTTATALTIYKSPSGKLYAITIDAAGEPGWEPVTVVPMVGTTPGDPKDPDDPDKPTNDRWGLRALSAIELARIPAYEAKADNALAMHVFYHAIADQIESGNITDARVPDGRTQIAVALDTARQSALGINLDTWSRWHRETSDELSRANVLGNAADTAQAIRDIADGLGVPPRAEMATDQAIQWDRLIKFFIEVLLPLIIRLIGGGI